MQQTSYEVYVNDTHTSVACRDSHVKRRIHVMYKYTIFTAVLSAGGIIQTNKVLSSIVHTDAQHSTCNMDIPKLLPYSSWHDITCYLNRQL